MTRQEAGRLGGRSTFKKHGSAHMSKIGKKGFQTMNARYDLQPLGTSDFAFICRKTGRVVARLSGRPVPQVTT